MRPLPNLAFIKMTPHALFFFQINDFINQIDMPNEKKTIQMIFNQLLFKSCVFLFINLITLSQG